jgi:predicted metal-dependent hydrolase
MTRGADPKAMALWRWHLIEELEHKATACDVYRAVGGKYTTRAFEMIMTCLLWPSSMLLMQMYLLARDGSIWNLRDVARGLWFAFGPRGLFSALLPGVLAYLRPGFHPWQRDDSALIAGWQPDGVASVRSIGGTSAAEGR